MFVENYPVYDGRMIPIAFNHFVQFFFELSFIFFGSFAKSTWHILPYQNSNFIAMIIPAFGFHFNMFPYHIKPPFFSFFYIPTQGFVSRCCVNTIGPVSLIERSHLENKFIVECQSLNAVFVFKRNFAHAGIAFYFIGNIACTVF